MKKLFGLFICALFVFIACKNQEPKDLVVSSIEIGGVKVTDNKVTVPESLTKVEIKNVSVTFVGENLPIVKMEPSELNLEYKGHEYNLKLSTDKTKDWKAWNSATIKVVRGGASNDTRLTEFTIDGAKGEVDNVKKTVLVKLPPGHTLTGLTPVIKGHGGATVTPTAAQDFTNSVATPIEYTVTAQDGTKQVYKVTARHVFTEAKIKTFKVSDISGLIKEDENPKILKVRISGHKDINLKSVTPIITVSDGAKVEPASEVLQDFSAGREIEYTVTAEDGVTKQKYNVTVKKIPEEVAITIFGYGIKKPTTQGGNWTAKIPKDKDFINLSDIKVQYKENGIIKTVVNDGQRIRITTDDQTSLAGATGHLLLELVVQCDPDYIFIGPKIEVSKLP